MALFRRHRLCAAVLVPCIAVTGPVPRVQQARAAGLAVREGSASAMATAYAGQTAAGDDASIVWSNPAAMVMLGTTLSSNLSVIIPNVRFHPGANVFEDGTRATGNAGGSILGTAVAPATYAVFKASPRLRLGFSLSSPYAARESYDPNWIGRTQALVASPTDITLQLAAAYALTEKLSIGGGPYADYFHIRLTNVSNLGPVLNSFGDTNLATDGHDFGVGYDVGLLYRFDDNNRIGINYHSRDEHNYEIKIKIKPPFGIPTGLGALIAGQSADGTQSVNLPDSLDVGYFHRCNSRLSVMANAEWTHWSLLSNISGYPDTSLPSQSVNFHFRNTVFLAAGADYAPTMVKGLILHAGVGYDQSPVTDQTRKAQIPDEDRIILAFGLSYPISKSSLITASYNHLFGLGGAEDGQSFGYTPGSPAQPSGTLTGNYTLRDDSIAVGLSTRF
jgi:long-chain fatty acid transport protein